MKIFISQGDGDLAGIEYTFIKLLNNYSNSKWIIVAGLKDRKNLSRKLSKLKLPYKRYLLKKNIIPFYHIFNLYLKFLKDFLKNKNSKIYASGIIVIIILAFLPISKRRKFIVIRNDIRILSTFQKKLLNFSLSKVDKVFTNNIFNHRFINRYSKYNNSIFTFDYPKFSEIIIKKRIETIKKNKNDLIKIVVISSMRPVKNPEGTAKFINLICRNRNNVQFILIGNNQKECLFDFLEKQALKNIFFTGFKSKEEINNILLSVNYLLSLSFSEGTPNSVIEAMSIGIPCILSNILPHQHLSEKESNYFISLKNLNNDSINISKKFSSSDSIGLRSINVKKSISNLSKKYLNFINAIDYNS